MWKVIDKARALWRWMQGYVSPVFLSLLCASFILWYILKLQYVYTTEYAVLINIDGERMRVPCVVEGKGANLFGYRVYMHKQIRIPLSELKYKLDKQVDEQTGEVIDTLCVVDPQSLQSAISVRFSDIKVISVDSIPPLPMPHIVEKTYDVKAEAASKQKK